MASVGVITVSDRSSRGERADASGPAIRDWALSKGHRVVSEVIVPDEFSRIRDELVRCADEGIEIIFTTGGTGFSVRDVTPEATLSVLEKNAPGIAEVMRMRSLAITPHAMLSRAVAGIRGRSIIVNLPGSPKAVKENLAAIEEALPHAVSVLQGSVSDCATPVRNG